MCVRSIVKGSIPRTGDERFDSAAGLDRDRRVALKRLPELALQYPAGGFPGLRLEPNIHLEAIPAVRYAASRCRSSPGSAGRAVEQRSSEREQSHSRPEQPPTTTSVSRSTPHDRWGSLSMPRAELGIHGLNR